MRLSAKPWHGPVTEVQAMGLLRAMVEIPSPSYSEALLAGYLVDAMRAFGFLAHIDEAGNAVGELSRGDGPTVMLLGHMDTAVGEIPVRCTRGRVYGRGAVDAKGPLAAMICAAATAEDFTGTVVVAGVVEEETPCSRGAMMIRQAYPPPDILIVGEPSGWSTVVVGYKGKLDLRYRVACPPTHPSNPVVKASEHATRCWQELAGLLGPAAGHATFDQPGATLTSISGDLSSAEAELSIRTPPGFDDGDLLARLRERMPAGEISVINSVRACRVSRANRAASALSAGIRRQRATPIAKVKTATSDMNTLAEVWQIPMATYGPGDSRLDHSDDEHITIAEYFRGIAVLATALTELGGAPYRPAVPRDIALSGSMP